MSFIHDLVTLDYEKLRQNFEKTSNATGIYNSREIIKYCTAPASQLFIEETKSPNADMKQYLANRKKYNSMIAQILFHQVFTIPVINMKGGITHITRKYPKQSAKALSSLQILTNILLFAEHFEPFTAYNLFFYPQTVKTSPDIFKSMSDGSESMGIENAVALHVVEQMRLYISDIEQALASHNIMHKFVAKIR